MRARLRAPGPRHVPGRRLGAWPHRSLFPASRGVAVGLASRSSGARSRIFRRADVASRRRSRRRGLARDRRRPPRTRRRSAFPRLLGLRLWGRPRRDHPRRRPCLGCRHRSLARWRGQHGRRGLHPEVDPAPRAHRPGDPRGRSRRRDHPPEPGTRVRRHPDRGRAAGASALASAGSGAQGRRRAACERVGRGADQRPESTVGRARRSGAPDGPHARDRRGSRRLQHLHGRARRRGARREPLISLSVVEGAGHSLHRDRPEESVRQLLEALA